MGISKSLDADTADFIRHWCPHSQRYAGCDALLTLLDQGWVIKGDITYDEYWHGGARRVLIYQVGLLRDGEHVTMRVLGNPAAESLMRDLQAKHPLVPKRSSPAQVVKTQH